MKQTTASHGKKAPQSTKSVSFAGQAGLDSEQILDGLVQGIRIIGPDYRVRFINRAMEKISGISREQAIGKSCRELFREPFCKSKNCTLDMILNGEKLVQREFESMDIRANPVTLMAAAFPLYGTDGQLIGMFESLRDITGQKELTNRLVEAEDQYRALVELGAEIGEAILMIQDTPDREGVITYASKQYSSLTGYSMEELLGTSGLDLVGAKYRNEVIDRHRRKMKGESLPGLYEVTIVRKDGTEVPVEVTTAQTIFRGKPANVIYLRDITQRKELEAAFYDEQYKYQSLFEAAPVAMWEVDYSRIKKYLDSLELDGVKNLSMYFKSHPGYINYTLSLSRVIRVNDAAVSLWEASSKGQLKSGILELFSSREGGLSREIENILAFKAGATRLEYQITDPTFKGNRKTLYAIYYIVPGCKKDWSRVIASYIDITEQKQAEAALRQYQDSLEDMVNERTRQLVKLSKALADEVKRRKESQKKARSLYKEEYRLRRQVEERIKQRVEFTRALVHELKTPLTPLLAICETLAGQVEEPRIKNMVEMILSGGRGINSRIDELTDVAKGEIGMLALDAYESDLVPVVEEISRYMSSAFKSRNHAFNTDIGSRVIIVKMDEKRIRQVLMNLLDNAYKFTPKNGSVALKLYVKGQNAIVEVQDNGLGISEEKKRGLFTPYANLASGSNNGMGLGLSLCKMLIDLHGGKIWHTNLKKGSCFGFSIPLVREPA